MSHYFGLFSKVSLTNFNLQSFCLWNRQKTEANWKRNEKKFVLFVFSVAWLIMMKTIDSNSNSKDLHVNQTDLINELKHFLFASLLFYWLLRCCFFLFNLPLFFVVFFLSFCFCFEYHFFVLILLVRIKKEEERQRLKTCSVRYFIF